MDIILFYTIHILFFSLLLFVPLGYVIFVRDPWKSFKFTWLTWTVVWFVWGICFPMIARLTERVTGSYPDYDGFIYLTGLGMGWVPGLFCAFLAWLLQKIIDLKRKPTLADQLDT